ncbi:YccF domain-containing protein [Lapillicoccus sp.]|uniref:YccF domain-containing protein n=1 Tax=Lapillicoccus sp. TaxID=1909287 RepID=UPI003267E373
MKLLLNVIWVVFGGWLLALSYVFAGVIACILIVTIPFGVAAFRMASFALWPFGRTIVEKPNAGVMSTIGNVLWILLFGWWLALEHLVTGIAQCITIVGIPLGLANFKLVPVSLVPIGKDIVPTSSVRAGASTVARFDRCPVRLSRFG